MIKALNLSYAYNNYQVLNGINLELPLGELIVLLGRNGEGKSTLFRLLTGETTPDSGEIQYFGKNLAAMDRRELAKTRSVLPQESTISFPLKVFEIVQMGSSPHRLNKLEINEYASKSMNLTDVYDLRNRFYSELSGGEKRRVQIARVLCQLEREPKVSNLNNKNSVNNDEIKGYLFLDEPVNSLDVLLQHKIMKILRNLANIGYMVFCILHDWNLAGLYGDRILVLQDGKIPYDGSARDVIRRDILENVFEIRANVFAHSNLRVGGYAESIY